MRLLWAIIVVAVILLMGIVGFAYYESFQWKHASYCSCPTTFFICPEGSVRVDDIVEKPGCDWNCTEPRCEPIVNESIDEPEMNWMQQQLDPSYDHAVDGLCGELDLSACGEQTVCEWMQTSSTIYPNGSRFNASQCCPAHFKALRCAYSEARILPGAAR
jgi:hypothetical protein